MSDIVFTCPSCGQHMQSPRAFVGDTTACSECQATVRIPFSYTPPEPDTQLPKGGLVTAAPARSAASDGQASVADIAAYRREDAGQHTAPGDTVVACHCPVCHVELRVSVSVQLHAAHQTAPAPTDNSAAPSHPETPVSPAEREKQIASARAERDISLYPQVKPRMSYILTGGERVAPNESPQEPAPPHSPPNPQAFPE